MDSRAEVKAFVSSRRAKITPEQAGLTSYNRNRRVLGLRRQPPATQIRPNVARILELMTHVPALVGNGRGDVLAANPLAQAPYAPMYEDPARPARGVLRGFTGPVNQSRAGQSEDGDAGL